MKGCWAAKREGFWLTRLTIGASNDLQMERSLTDGLPVIYQGHSANLGPFRERFSPLTTKDKRGTPEDIGVPDCKTDNEEKARMHETNTNANEMHMMT